METIGSIILILTNAYLAFRLGRALGIFRSHVDSKMVWWNRHIEMGEDIVTYAVFYFVAMISSWIIFWAVMQKANAIVEWADILPGNLVWLLAHCAAYSVGFFPQIGKMMSNGRNLLLIFLLMGLTLVGCTVEPPGDDPDFPELDGSWVEIHDVSGISASTRSRISNNSAKMCSIATMPTTAYLVMGETVNNRSEYTKRIRQYYDVDWVVALYTREAEVHYSAPAGYTLNSDQLGTIRYNLSQSDWEEALIESANAVESIYGFNSNIAGITAIIEDCEPPVVNVFEILIYAIGLIVAWTGFCVVYAVVTGDVDGAGRLWARGIVLILEAAAESRD